jgi:hypothetical protein
MELNHLPAIIHHLRSGEDNAGLTREVLAKYLEAVNQEITAREANTTHPEEWAIETMQMINELTPNIEGKAFHPGWFLLRQRLEEAERTMKYPTEPAEPIEYYFGPQGEKP